MEVTDLPQEVASNILQNFSALELAKLSCVSKFFQEFCAFESLWLNRAAIEFGVPKKALLNSPVGFLGKVTIRPRGRSPYLGFVDDPSATNKTCPSDFSLAFWYTGGNSETPLMKTLLSFVSLSCVKHILNVCSGALYMCACRIYICTFYRTRMLHSWETSGLWRSTGSFLGSLCTCTLDAAKPFLG